MSIETRLRYSLAHWLLKASQIQTLNTLTFPGWQRASDTLLRGFEALTREGYQKNAVVFACLSALAFDFPEPPLLVYGEDSDDAKALPKHPLRKLIARPNAFMGERELWMYTMVYLGIGGNAYWHKVRNARGQVIELWPYHTLAIQPYTDPTTPHWIDHYLHTTADGRQIAVPVKDIVHFKWPSVDMAQPWLAQPPLLAVSAEVGADNEMTLYLQSLMLNDAIPRTILVQNPNRFMSPDEIDRAKNQFMANYGSNKRGGVMILEAGTEIKRLGLDLQEMAFDAMHKVPEKRIAAAFRVPLSVAGIGDDPTYSNSEEAYSRYIRSTLAPLWKLTDDEVQNSLGDEFGVWVERDLTKVSALQEDQNQLWGRVNSAFQAGRLTLNQANQLCGLPPVPGGDMYLWSASVFPVPAAQVGAMATAEAEAALRPPTPPVQALPAPDPTNNETDLSNDNDVTDVPKQAEKASLATARRLARALQRIRRRIEPRCEKAIAGYFADLAEVMVQRAENSAKNNNLPTIEQLFLEIDGVKLVDLLQRYYLEIIQASWETWNISIGIEAAFEQTDPAVVATLAHAGLQVRQINDTTLTALRDLLQYGADQGWSLEQLVEGTADHVGLRKIITETYAGRARTIARTELGTAQQHCAIERYHAAGIDQVYVHDNGMDDSDPRCTALNGTIQSLDWARQNRLQHPNCVRCFAPYVEE
jgi:HK97 family phage portal protein